MEGLGGLVAERAIRNSSRPGIRLAGWRFWPRALGRVLVRSVTKALEHDCVNIAQSTAYSAMVALFPALIVLAAGVALMPYSTPLRGQLGVFFNRVLPSEVIPVLQSYFVAKPGSPRTASAVLGGVLVSLSGASGVIATLMEGLRRAHGLPEDCWTFWQRRGRALLLVPLSLLPLLGATLLVVFGHAMTLWLGSHVAGEARRGVYVVAFAVRWAVALTGSVGLIALLYTMGTPRRQNWRSVLPGAVVATVLWFVATLVFGWYVTRFANYSQVYGSLGAGIALLLWLYIVCLCVLCGAEFNVQFAAEGAVRLPKAGGPDSPVDAVVG